jgi:hypothetical protein
MSSSASRCTLVRAALPSWCGGGAPAATAPGSSAALVGRGACALTALVGRGACARADPRAATAPCSWATSSASLGLGLHGAARCGASHNATTMPHSCTHHQSSNWQARDAIVSSALQPLFTAPCRSLGPPKHSYSVLKWAQHLRHLEGNLPRLPPSTAYMGARKRQGDGPSLMAHNVNREGT